ncbi:Uncharacterised protein [Mycobacteroides abscessus]|nr:Uncharacterised protein [Mycobacteroides abscessus]
MTIARKRSVWPATQFAMYPPKDPPIAAVRVASISARASTASVIASRSVYGALPHAPHPRCTKSCPYPVDSAGSGSSTA